MHLWQILINDNLIQCFTWSSTNSDSHTILFKICHLCCLINGLSFFLHLTIIQKQCEKEWKHNQRKMKGHLSVLWNKLGTFTRDDFGFHPNPPPNPTINNSPDTAHTTQQFLNRTMINISSFGYCTIHSNCPSVSTWWRVMLTFHANVALL